MYAVIRAGGKQYRVSPGDVLDVERLRAAGGETVAFPALLVVDGDQVRVRPEELRGVVVRAEVLGHRRGRKVRVFTYHAKTGWKRTAGHRQELTTVRITGIGPPEPEPAVAQAAESEE